jgi:signal transduction histidine kinase
VVLGRDLGTLEADEHLLRQALVNVLINAAEAQSAQGTVWIKGARRKVGAHDHVELTIEDEGARRADVGDRVFDPFFTTKAFGTGLGLTIVKRTVEAHGGSVELSAREGGGTVVTIVLPLGPAAVVRGEIRS